MKRPLDFESTDNVVLDVINDMVSNNNNNISIKKIQKIGEVEMKIDNMIKRMMRTNFALESKPDIVKKILRISISHSYHQADVNDRAHYMILIEGHILDENLMYMIPFGSFFDKIRLVLDKRIIPSSELFEWSASELPDGHKADCFRFKMYTDKPLNIKIFLHRTEDGGTRKRVEIADQLRALLPNIAIDPTEDEVMLAIWEYIDSRHLIDSKGMIKCEGDKDRSFLAIVRQESFHMSNLKQKLQPYLLPCKPIQVDYNVTVSSITPSINTNRPGRIFDIEVDTPDPYSFEILNSLNSIILKQRELESRQLELYLMTDYLSKSIVNQKQIVDDLHGIVTDPLTYGANLGVDEKCVVINNSKIPNIGSNNNKNNINNNSRTDDDIGRKLLKVDFKVGDILNNSVDPYLMLDRISKKTDHENELVSILPCKSSACHSLTHFIDVGDDELFQNKKFVEKLYASNNR